MPGPNGMRICEVRSSPSQLLHISAPLVASGQYLGCLSVGHTQPNMYTEDHLRRTELLAIPAAAAIQNARLYETARIYRETLELRIAELKRTETALAQSEDSRRCSEEKFEKVFQSSPVPFFDYDRERRAAHPIAESPVHGFQRMMTSYWIGPATNRCRGLPSALVAQSGRFASA